MKKINLLYILFFVTLGSISAQTGTIKIQITNIEHNKGTIKAALYNESEKSGFLKNIESAFQKKAVTIEKNKAYIEFNNIPYGIYAVSVFHDENNNNEMDRNSIGFPIEAYGISGNKTTVGPPDFDSGKFSFKSPVLGLQIKMKKLFRQN